MQILKIVIIIADNNDLIDILIMDILCPNRITNQYSIFNSILKSFEEKHYETIKCKLMITCGFQE